MIYTQESLSVSVKTVFETLLKNSIKNTCTISYADLEDKSGYCKSSVVSAIQQLTLIGIIEKISSPVPNPNNIPNTYVILSKSLGGLYPV
ncbi:hypothetical protein QUF74_19815 [Candidatus Halobeggiatoa sp. HSG11]|nr:hypothetical protein [Candidatus Halobeggiatoa sp. HSG11]